MKNLPIHFPEYVLRYQHDSHQFQNLKYNFLNRSRKAEIQADSLGFVIFNKTDFNKKSSANSLKKLDFINDMVFNEDTKIKSHFQFEEYPFKDSWLTPEETLFNIKEKKDDYALDKDSLKTHPDIPLRIELIEESFKKSKEIAETTSELKKIKKIASENSIKISLDNSNIDLALYQTLIMFNKKQIDEKAYCNIIGFSSCNINIVKPGTA